VAKLSMSGKHDSIVIGPAFINYYPTIKLMAVHSGLGGH
jgi:hypothetical protein